MKISHEFIPYEQALELKELGFDEKCLCSWMSNDYIVQYQKRHKEDDTYLPAPLYQQAFKWFREKYSINSWIINAEDNNNAFKPFFRGNNIDEHLVDFYNTYEEAELARLKKLIEIAKNK
jgi:hypothetical protein